MIVKPSISFITSDTDAQLLVSTNTIITSMTGNANYPKPAPTLAQVTVALAGFSDAIAAAADGGMTLTTLKNDQRAILAGLLRLLASYVHVTCNGDLAILQSSGFPIQKPVRQPVGILPAPVGLALSRGGRSGDLDAKATPVPGASTYNWRLSLTSKPEAILRYEQSIGASITFPGLTPTADYTVILNAVGTAGPSDWSAPANLIVL